MSAALGFFTYLWHYLIARLLYDQLLSPLLRGRPLALLLACALLLTGAMVRWAVGAARRRRP